MVTNRNRKSFGLRRQNSKCCSDDWHRWCFWSVFRHFGTHFAETFRMSKSSWIMDPARSREMPICPAIDLAEIRWSSKITPWTWSIISGVITVLGRPGRGASQMEKITTFKLGHPVFDGDIIWWIFPYCFLKNGVNLFRRLSCRGGGLDDSSRLDVFEIVRVAWRASFQPM